MSNGYRNGAFALGIVVGGGVVLNLVLWSAHRANNLRETAALGQEGAETHPWIGPWDWFASTFFIPEDSIAQWSMAILSLAAVYLLWETLKASRKTLNVTREMAAETTRIGEAQVSAHLMPVDLSVIQNETQDYTEITGYFKAKFTIRNVGNTPAYRVSVAAVTDGFGDKEWFSVIPTDVGPNETSEVSLKSCFDPATLQVPNHNFTMRIYVKFDTIFSRKAERDGKQVVRFDYKISSKTNGGYEIKRL